MSRDGSVDVKVPDLGDFKDVAVIDVLVKAGDTVAVETPLITLETEKAAMDVPSPAAGVIAEVTVRTGDRVNTGSVIARLRSRGAGDGGCARLVAQGRDRAAPGPARIGALRRRAVHGHRADRADGKREKAAGSASLARRGGAGIKDDTGVETRAGALGFTGGVRLRSPRPGRRAGRLYGRVSRRRSRSQGRAGRTLASARRCVSERRVHPVEGAAACGACHRRSERDGSARHQLRQADDRRRPACASGRAAWSIGWPEASPGLPASARSR